MVHLLFHELSWCNTPFARYISPGYLPNWGGPHMVVIGIYKQVPAPPFAYLHPPSCCHWRLATNTLITGGTSCITIHCSYGGHRRFLDFQNQTLKKFSANLLCLFVFIYFLHYFSHDQYRYLNKNALCTRANAIRRIPIEHAALK